MERRPLSLKRDHRQKIIDLLNAHAGSFDAPRGGLHLWLSENTLRGVSKSQVFEIVAAMQEEGLLTKVFTGNLCTGLCLTFRLPSPKNSDFEKLTEKFEASQALHAKKDETIRSLIEHLAKADRELAETHQALQEARKDAAARQTRNRDSAGFRVAEMIDEKTLNDLKKLMQEKPRTPD